MQAKLYTEKILSPVVTTVWHATDGIKSRFLKMLENMGILSQDYMYIHVTSTDSYSITTLSVG